MTVHNLVILTSMSTYQVLTKLPCMAVYINIVHTFLNIIFKYDVEKCNINNMYRQHGAGNT